MSELVVSLEAAATNDTGSFSDSAREAAGFRGGG